MFICAKHKGRTIHLLKASSKPVPQERKRRKVSMLGTYEQYKHMKEESKQEEPAGEEFMEHARSEKPQMPAGRGYVPNIIGNVEDGEYPPVEPGQQSAFAAALADKREQQPVSEPDNFADITG